MTNIKTIEMHLEEFAREYPGQTWFSIMGYVIGYYGIVTLDHIMAIQSLEQRGLINE